MNPMLFKAPSVNLLYQSLCESLYYRPHYQCAPRGERVKEILDCCLLLTNPRDRIITLPGRSMDLSYLAGELGFYFSGRDDLSIISYFSKFWNKVSDDGKTVNSAYGKRLFIEAQGGMSQFQYAFYCLMKDKDSRKAIAMIYKEKDTNTRTKDNACTLSLQFFIRDNALHCITTMRSNDIWRGLPYDLPFFTLVQELMLVELKQVYPDLKLGSYAHRAHSMHAYEKHFADVRKIADDTHHSETSRPMSPATRNTWKGMEWLSDTVIALSCKEPLKTKGGSKKDELSSEIFSMLSGTSKWNKDITEARREGR